MESGPIIRSGPRPVKDAGAFFQTGGMSLVRDVRELAAQSTVPVCLNQDHGAGRDTILKRLQAGFTSVMINRSACDCETNVRETRDREHRHRAV